MGGKFLKRDPDESVDPFFSFAGIPDENKLFDRSRDGGCFAQQNNSGTLSTGREASKMCRHSPPILGDKNSRGVRRDPQDFWIFQSWKGGIRRSAHVDLGHCPSQPRKMRPSRSASPWNLTGMPRPL